MFEIINIWAVLAASVAGFIFGSIWYSPFLFMKTWMDATGKTPEKIATSGMTMKSTMLYGYLAGLAVAFVLAVFIALTGANTFVEILSLALLLCFGFVVTTQYTRMIYESDEAHWSIRPQKLFLISAGYQIGIFIVMSVVFSLFL